MKYEVQTKICIWKLNKGSARYSRIVNDLLMLLEYPDNRVRNAPNSCNAALWCVYIVLPGN